MAGVWWLIIGIWIGVILGVFIMSILAGGDGYSRNRRSKRRR